MTESSRSRPQNSMLPSPPGREIGILSPAKFVTDLWPWKSTYKTKDVQEVKRKIMIYGMNYAPKMIGVGPANRNYRKSDLSIIAALAAAAGFNAVTLFALYVSSDTVRHLYRYPLALWLICPILLYWLGRALMMAHRRRMNDDPIIFALKDWNSLFAFGLIAIIMLGAM